ncbi:hypothetical protein CLV62_12066 [Dysgonomonas alginatilytica]|uniref:Minor capsid protein n=1 Tax=Dysgonomonas alginatilytica TaxID=1605892 RepID=A0A2V3PLA5_9BACT|nr:hypothetical protein [Dysgonomonas alginatilytica]PXV62377.1 hypothetical protein CLV62_12066 [Dysgonomonas alginatilytica]
MNLNYDIQKIEKALAEAIRIGNVTEKVFLGQRPNLKDTSMTDFTVVSVASQITDLSALGTCMCQIELFAKNLSNGEKNATKLSLLYSRLLTIFPIQNDIYLFDIHPTVIPLGDDNYGYNVIAILIQTHIKTL